MGLSAQDYAVNHQKLQPKFKDCTFDSDKKPEYLRTWLRLLSGIVRNAPHGKDIENFLDHYLQRQLHEATTRPAFLSEPGLQLHAPGQQDELGEASSLDQPVYIPKSYHKIPVPAQALDKALFHTLFTIVQGK